MFTKDYRPSLLELTSPSILENGTLTDSAEIARRTAAMRTGLLAQGYPPGSRVAVSVRNSANAVAVFLALLGTDLIIVPLNTSLPLPEQMRIVADARPVAIVADRGDVGAAEQSGLPLLHLADLLETEAPHAPAVARPPEALALILYTSGSTGHPKGVKFQVGRLTGNSRQFAGDLFRIDGDDVLLLPMEVSSIISVTLVLAACRVGATLAIAADHRPGALLETLKRDRVTMMMTVTTVAEFLLKLTQGEPEPLPDLRIIVIGGNYVSASLSDDLIRAFDARVDVIYATTEVAPTTYLFDRQDAPDGAVGPAVDGVDIRITDPDGNIVPEGEPGELIVSGAPVALGYWTGEDGDSMDFHGRFATGDLGYRDDQGHYHIIGRSKEVIKSGGLSVYPPEVETVLATHPGIASVAVVGKPHERFGEIVVAFVVPAPGHSLTSSEIIAWSKQNLASGKCPRSVKILDAMPQTTTGKIAKSDLKAMV